MQGGFLDCARNDGMGMDISCIMQRKSVWETRSSRIVIPSGVEGSFSLAARGRMFGSEKRETPYRGKTVGGASRQRHSEGVMEKRDENDFSLLEMRGGYPRKKC